MRETNTPHTIKNCILDCKPELDANAPCAGLMIIEAFLSSLHAVYDLTMAKEDGLLGNYDSRHL